MSVGSRDVAGGWPALSDRLRLGMLASLAALCACVQPLRAQDPDAFIGATAELFTNFTLIDGRGGPPQEGWAILVWNGRIQSTAPRSRIQIPQGTTIIDLDGAHVLPGFIDAHAAPRDSASLAAMLAAGVTGVRESAMPLARFTTNGRDALGGDPLPLVYIGGPVLEGPGGTSGIRIGSVDEVQGLVEALVDQGAPFISIASDVPTEWVRDIARAARRRDAAAWMEGREEGWLLAVRSGAEFASRLVSLDPDLVPGASRDDYAVLLEDSPSEALGEWLRLLDLAGPEVDLAVSAFLSGDAAIAPLLAASEAPLRCVSSGDGCRGRSDAERGAVLRLWPKVLEFTRILHEQGVRMLVGSGNPTGPGSAARFHRELELLVEAGISPIDVLSMATRNGAIALGQLHRRGTIEDGKRADFIVLDADPLVDIRNARTVELIVIDGKAWTPLEEGGFQRVRFR